MDELISSTVAAGRLGVSARWLAKLCQQGRIPDAKKIGGAWIIPAGAKIEPTALRPLGRPLKTLEIPREAKKTRPGASLAGGGKR